MDHCCVDVLNHLNTLWSDNLGMQLNIKSGNASVEAVSLLIYLTLNKVW